MSVLSCPSRPQRFPFYPVFLYVGLLMALVVADLLARRSGIDPVRLVAAFLLAMPVALAGSRVLEVALNASYYRSRPREIWRVSRGGAAMYGALPALALLAPLLARAIGTTVGTFWDIALVAILAGMIPTRFGCLGSGCCAGRETASRFGLFLRDAHGHRARRFPNQLLEAALGAVLLCIALLGWKRAPFPGAVALFITAGYGAGRFALEGLREERAPQWAGLSAYRWMSAGLFVIGTVGLALGFGASEALPAIDVALATDARGALHLVVSGLLLLPVVHLFRFIGCDEVFGLEGRDEVMHLLQMIVIFPDQGTGDPAVRMRFAREPELTEISQSPVELASVGTEADGRLRFEKLQELPEGSYTVTCTVSRSGALTRTGSCSGDLNAPGLVVAFNADGNTAPNVVMPRLCFQTL